MVRAIVLTHCHEDHIGALPYILRDLNVPIYGTRFTLALVRRDSKSTACWTRQSSMWWRRQTIKIGPFGIEFIP